MFMVEITENQRLNEKIQCRSLIDKVLIDEPKNHL